MNGIFFFDPTDKIYADHFPGNPVVPGSLIVSAFIKAGEKIGFPTKRLIVKNFRFKKFIPPGEYRFNIKCSQNRLNDKVVCKMECNLYYKNKAVVTGTFLRQ